MRPPTNPPPPTQKTLVLPCKVLMLFLLFLLLLFVLLLCSLLLLLFLFCSLSRAQRAVQGESNVSLRGRSLLPRANKDGERGREMRRRRMRTKKRPLLFNWSSGTQLYTAESPWDLQLFQHLLQIHLPACKQSAVLKCSLSFDFIIASSLFCLRPLQLRLSLIPSIHPSFLPSAPIHLEGAGVWAGLVEPLSRKVGETSDLCCSFCSFSSSVSAPPLPPPPLSCHSPFSSFFSSSTSLFHLLFISLLPFF